MARGNAGHFCSSRPLPPEPVSRPSPSRLRSAALVSNSPIRWWLLLVFGVVLASFGGFLWMRPPLLPVADLDHPEKLDPMVRQHVEEVLSLVRKNPRDSIARATLGMAMAANGLWKEARPVFLDVARQDLKEPLAPMYAAVALEEQSDTAGALREFRELVRRFPEFPQGWYRVAESSLRSGDLDAAEMAFQKLVQLAPKEWRGPAGLAEIRIRRGRHAEAVPLLEQAVSLDRTSKPALYLLGQAYRAVGRTNEARLAIAAGSGESRQPMPDPWGEAAPNHIRALPDLLQQADALSTAGRPDFAVQLLQKALPFHPTHPGLLLQLAVAMNRSGRAAQALPILDRLVLQDPKAVAPRITRAFTRDLLGQPAAGIEDAREAIRLAPRMSQAHLALADALLAQEKDREAVGALEEAIRCDPGNAEIHVELAEITWRNLNDKAGGLDHLRQAVELDPALVRARVAMAWLQLELKDREGARGTVAVVRKLAPQSRELEDLLKALAQP